MRDPRQHVLPNQPLKLAAAQVNALNSLMRTSGGMQGGLSADWPQGSNIILVKTFDVIVAQLSVLTISGVVSDLDPSGGTLTSTGALGSRVREFVRRPVLIGATPNIVHAGQLCITIEPIDIGKIGRAVVGGMFPCRVNVTDANHRFATVKHGDVSQLQSSRCGPVSLLWKESGIGECKWAVGVM